MYEYIERNSDKIKKNIKAYFQNARLGLLKYDELNKSQIDEEVDDLFDKVLSLNNNLLKNLIKDLEYDEEDYPIEMLNDRYSKTTKYVFANELERKRSRYKENIISSMFGIADYQGKRKDFSKEAMLGALSSMAFIKLQNDTARFVAQQIEECAVDNERYMYLQEGMKEGVEYVRWVSMDDGRDCDECHELNGQIFPIDAVPDKFHWGCRCEMEYVSQEELDGVLHFAEEENTELPLRTIETNKEDDIIPINYDELYDLIVAKDTEAIKEYIQKEGLRLVPEDFYLYLLTKDIEILPLGKGNLKGVSFEDGGGYRLVLDSNKTVIFHPEYRTHHSEAYWKISSNGIVKRYKTDGTEI